MKESTRKIVFEFIEKITQYNIFYIILFGSTAKDKETSESDIDLFIVINTEEDIDSIRDTVEIKQAAFQLEKKYDRNIQLLITNKNYDRVEDYSVQKISSEGIILYARAPEIKINGVNVEPFAFVSYDLSKLSHPEKMHFRNELYGYNTTRKYKKKIYKNIKPGLLEKLKGRKIGLGTVMIPMYTLSSLERLLDSYKILYKEIDAWLY